MFMVGEALKVYKPIFLTKTNRLVFFFLRNQQNQIETKSVLFETFVGVKKKFKRIELNSVKNQIKKKQFEKSLFSPLFAKLDLGIRI